MSDIICDRCNCLPPICDCCKREVDHVRGSYWHGDARICCECFGQWYDPDNEQVDQTDPVSIGNYIRGKHGLPPLAAPSPPHAREGVGTMPVYHAIERTSPKGPGSKFIGTCRLCGTPNLPASAALLECPNQRGLTTDESIIEAIAGEPTEPPRTLQERLRFQFRKRPIVIEAVRFSDRISEIDGPEPDWYTAARTIHRGNIGSITYSDRTLRIMTLEGEMTANPGDWIIRGIKGELYPIKDDIFAATYEPVAALDAQSQLLAEVREVIEPAANGMPNAIALGRVLAKLKAAASGEG